MVGTKLIRQPGAADLDWLDVLDDYGTWRGRGSNTVNKYMLAGNSMPWYAIAFSIMATQASAITFISTTGQSYVDGMRFVQFYFGLPIAMIILSFTLVPLFHRAKVYSAYEYLEQRFDAKTRALASVIFLIERGLAVGIALYAMAIVLSIILGWSDRITILIVGALALLCTTMGGVVAVTWTEFPQMIVMTCGLLGMLIAALWLLPHGVSPLGAVKVAIDFTQARVDPFALSDSATVLSQAASPWITLLTHAYYFTFNDEHDYFQFFRNSFLLERIGQSPQPSKDCGTCLHPSSMPWVPRLYPAKEEAMQ